jgi:hypothetical protein
MISACSLDMTALSNQPFVGEAERSALYRELDRPIWRVLVLALKAILRDKNLGTSLDLSLKVTRTALKMKSASRDLRRGARFTEDWAACGETAYPRCDS